MNVEKGAIPDMQQNLDEKSGRKPFLSVVTPVYNAPEIVEELHRQLCEQLEKLTDRFEIVRAEAASSAAKLPPATRA